MKWSKILNRLIGMFQRQNDCDIFGAININITTGIRVDS